MKKITQVIKKNYKVLLRNKFSLFTMIFGPILIILILGFLFNNQNTYNINVGVYTPEQTPLYNSYIKNLENDGFKIITYTSNNLCRDSLKKGMTNLCIIFPQNFELKNNHTNSITIIIDPSKKNIEQITQSLVLNSLSSQSQIYQINNTKGLVDVVEQNEINAIELSKQINELNELNINLKQNSLSIEKKLIELKSTLKINTVDFDSVQTKAKSINSSVQDFAISALNLTSDSKKYLLNVSTIIQSQTFNGSDDVKDKIDDVEDNILKLEVKINSLKTNYNFKVMQTEIVKVNSQLDVLKTSISNLNDNIEDLIETNNNYLGGQSNNIYELNQTTNSILNTISTVKITDAKSIVKPIEVKIEKEQKSNTHLSTMIPSLIVALIFIIAIILASNFVLMEKESSSYFRNFLTKNTSFNFFFGDFIALSSIIFMQVLLIITIYYAIFIRSFNIDLLYLILSIIPIIFTFVLIGMIVGYISNNQTTNIILSFSTIFVFFTLSGSLLPIELLPLYLKNLVINNPYIIAEGIIRKLTIFNSSLIDLKLDFLYMGIYILLFMILNLFFESITKRRLVYQYYVAFELRLKSKIKKN